MIQTEQPTRTPRGSDDRGDRMVFIYRHTPAVRVLHWVNFITLEFSRPLLSMEAMQDNQGHTRGVTTVGSHTFVTTGLFGWSMGGDGYSAE